MAARVAFRLSRVRPTSERPTRRVIPAGPIGVMLAGVIGTSAAHAATIQYFAGDGSALTASKYGSSPTGPFTSAFTSGNVVGFGVPNGTGTGAAGITIGGITAVENFTLTSPTGTLSTGGSVVTVSVADGKTLNLGAVSLSAAAGTGFVKSGNGVFYEANGNAYGGGFTLSAGTMIAGGVNALGGASGNTLTLNGGTLAGSKTNDYSGKFSGGITFGGDVQFGLLSANSSLVTSDTYNQTFSDTIALGNSARTLTLGNRGTQTFSGVISGGAGLTFAAVSGAESTVSGNGTFAITGTSNTFAGPVTINGPEVTFAADGGLGNVSNTLNLNGGRFTATASFTLTAARGIQVGSAAGTSISAKGGTTVLTYNGVIANLGGANGVLVKQGSGSLALGGVSTYAGDTSINNGTLQLTTGDNRLPVGTTINLGQAASTNLGTFDLNGHGQRVAGLNSVTGTSSSTTSNNTVTSTAAATLTLGGTGSYAYGDGTAANSGLITGALAVAKTGSGSQRLGGANTYTGDTTITGGTLVAINTSGSATGTGTVIVGDGTNGGSGTLAGTGTVGAVTINRGGKITAGTGATNADTVGTLTTGNQAWAAGGTDAIKGSTAGTHDLLAMQALNLAGLSASNRFVLNLVSLKTTPTGTLTIAQTTGITIASGYTGSNISNGIVSAGADLTSLFTLTVDGVTPTGTYSVTTATDAAIPADLDLQLTYSATPEPATAGLMLLGGSAMLSRRRRRISGVVRR